MAGALELILADGRTPTGGYAHSGGLERAVADGLTLGEVPGFIRARLRTVGRCDAALAALASGAYSLEGLLLLDLEWAARTPAPPLREASRRLGRGLLRTALAWWPDDDLLARYRDASSLTPRPVALGAVARAAGMPPAAAARVALYDDAATVAAAATKLLPVDAAVASGWVVALGVEIDALARGVGDAGVGVGDAGVGVGDAGVDVGDLPSTCTPLLDHRAMRHATTERRLFAS